MTNLAFYKKNGKRDTKDKEVKKSGTGGADMKKKIGLTVVLLMGLLQGCGAKVTENNLSHLHFVKAMEEMGDKTPEERARTIKTQLYQIEEITGCGVIVEGHTAIIGLRLQENLEQNKISSVRKAVDSAAKEADEFIQSTSITTNTYIVSMIEEMEQKRAG